MHLLLVVLTAFSASPLIDDDYSSHQLQRDCLDSVVLVRDHGAGSGSGVTVWSSTSRSGTKPDCFESFVLTAYHCVDSGDVITVYQATAESDRDYVAAFSADVVAFDKLADIAVLRVVTDERLPSSRVVPLDRIPQGRFMTITIGCSGGAYPTIRSERVIERDASIQKASTLWVTQREGTRGRSGGPLISLDVASGSYGQVIGLALSHSKGRAYYCDTAAMHRVLHRAGVPRAALRSPSSPLFLEFDFIILAVQLIVLTFVASNTRL